MFRPETREQKLASYRKVAELSDLYKKSKPRSGERKALESVFFAACSLTDDVR